MVLDLDLTGDFFSCLISSHNCDSSCRCTVNPWAIMATSESLAEVIKQSNKALAETLAGAFQNLNIKGRPPLNCRNSMVVRERQAIPR